MAKAVFMHKQGSGYHDLPEQHYHFPNMYLSRAKPSLGDWIIYYRPGKGKFDRVYTAIAEVESITPDLDSDSHHYANLRPGSFLAFDNPVPLKTDGTYANRLIQRADGKPNGLAQAAIHPIGEEDFWAILNRGFDSDEEDELPRVHELVEPNVELELGEAQQAEYVVPTPRQTVETTYTKKVRSRLFRRQVIRAYDKTCAFTGLRFINGGGRAEVEAAHIQPVEADGPDIISNGLALSGTVHWMFDRGLLGLSDGGEILVSRHINNIDEANRILLPDRRAKLPEKLSDRPHPIYLSWHRENCFKH
jgi:putative restriction endonuclease